MIFNYESFGRKFRAADHAPQPIGISLSLGKDSTHKVYFDLINPENRFPKCKSEHFSQVFKVFRFCVSVSMTVC